MKGRWLLCASAIAAIAIGAVPAASAGSIPLYTGEDLDRMFGPAPPAPSDPVDKSRPEDWRFVEQFLDRQYSRIDADRDYDLSKRSLDIAENRVARRPIYGYSPVAWGLGYPASTWWQSVWSSYSGTSYSGSDDRERRRHGGHSEMSTMNRGPRGRKR
jgi:hypothetical protein